MSEVHLLDRQYRAALKEVAPIVPELALQLDDDPSCVREAILENLGSDEADVCPKALLKTERYTLLHAGMRSQVDLLTEGRGREARFIDASCETGDQLHISRLLIGAYATLQVSENWWRPVAQRFDSLRDELPQRKTAASRLSRAFTYKEALQNGINLEKEVTKLTYLVNHDPLPRLEDPREKEQAMHDLSYLVLSYAGINIESFMGVARDVPFIGRIVHNEEAAMYLLMREGLHNNPTQTPGPRTPLRPLFPRTVSSIDTPTLKCPMHQGENDPLVRAVHASIDCTAAFGHLNTTSAR